ncbi:MAG: cartilage acidic protein, partial [Acaryochloridaceae cyanobacterium RL_2_7]|nr:cartilage acidic protein [Acaryochloridaceae cyanobacterium RL_2_7]
MLGDIDGDYIPEFLLPTRDSQSLKIYKTTEAPFLDISDSFLQDIQVNAIIDMAIADFNGDLRQDILLLSADQNHSVLLNQGTTFTKAAFNDDLNQTSQAKSVVAGDWDNDGDQDLFIVRSGDSREDGLGVNSLDYLLLNDGSGSFSRVTNPGAVGGTNLGIGDSATVVDFNLDGFLDLFVTNGDLSGQAKNLYNNGPSQLFRNQGNTNNSIEIDLQGTESNRDAIGATVIITTPDGQQQIRAQNGGIHNRAQSYTRLHFGLGTQTRITEIQVIWPNGMTQRFNNIAANQVIQLTEGRNQIETRFSYGVSRPQFPVLGTLDDDRLMGTGVNNIMNGRAGDDTLKGQGGNDTLLGGNGDDYLVGGVGSDILRGGAGNDSFVFITKAQGSDQIEGFFRENDRILIKRSG